MGSKKQHKADCGFSIIGGKAQKVVSDNPSDNVKFSLTEDRTMLCIELFNKEAPYHINKSCVFKLMRCASDGLEPLFKAIEEISKGRFEEFTLENAED